jgi:streptogramin lyase
MKTQFHFAVATTLFFPLTACVGQTADPPPEPTARVTSALCPAAPASTFTYTSMVVGGIVGGADGNIWLTDRTTSQVVQVTPGKGVTWTQNTWSKGSANPGAMVNGPNKTIWFTEPGLNKIGRIDLTTSPPQVTDWPGAPNAQIPNAPTALAVGPDRNVWVVEGGKVGFLDLRNNSWSQLAVAFPAGVVPTNITAGPDGTMWLTTNTSAVEQLACISGGQTLAINSPACTPWTLQLTKYALPANVTATGPLVPGPDGNLWFPQLTSTKSGGFTYNTYQVGRISTAGAPQTATANLTTVVNSLVYGPDGNMWYSVNSDVAGIGEIAPDGTLLSTNIVLPPASNGSSTTGGYMATGADGNVWVVDLSVTSGGVTTSPTTQISALSPCATCVTPQMVTATTLASGGYPASVVSDGATVYWTNFWGGGSVQSIPREEGAVATVAGNRNGPFGLTVDSTNVYWTEGGTNGQVAMAPKGGGATTVIATNQTNPRGIAVGGSTVYWTNNAPANMGGAVMSAPAQANATPSPLAGTGPQENPFGIVLTGGLVGGVGWVNQGDSGQGNGAVLLWTAPFFIAPGHFRPASTRTVANGQGGAFGIALSSDGVGPFWTNFDQGTVNAELSGSETVLASHVTAPRDIVVDGAWNSGPAPVVYFTDFTTPGTIWYVKNGQQCALSTGETTPQGLYVDDTYVYWTNFVGSGTVRRAAKVPQ